MSLQKFINERLKITSNTKSIIVSPTSKEQLKSIIKDELERQGPDANFNHIDVSGIDDMSKLFEGLQIESIKIDQWDTSNVKNMEDMFNQCENFNCDLSKWDVSNVTNMSYMFNFCGSFKGTGLGKWDVSNVTNMEGTFRQCISFNTSLPSWGKCVSNVTNMEQMFYGCTRFEGKGIERWDISNVTNMNRMFTFCEALNTNFLRWGKRVSKVTNMMGMFSQAYEFEGTGLDTWDVSNVTDMREMFNQCEKLNVDLSAWDVSNVTKWTGVFDKCPMPTKFQPNFNK